MNGVRIRRPQWLRTWEQIRDREGTDWNDLLLGNGASMAIDHRFGYSSLMDIARKPSCPHRLGDIDIALFERIGTQDFERVLRLLYQSAQVDELLELPTRRHRERYEAIRNALISAIGLVHPDFFELDENRLRTASDFIANFDRVFTTNYDLLLYWIIMYTSRRFGDYFWGPGRIFDQRDTRLRNRTAVTYLHGALFLFSTEEGAVRKITARRSDLLTRIRDELETGAVPVFVSEGSSGQKWATVRRHDYLTFGFRELQTSDEDLVIFGHSLSRQDSHVIRTIRLSERENVAYSIHVDGRPAHRLEATRERIVTAFPGKRVLFFDSNTFPIFVGD